MKKAIAAFFVLASLATGIAHAHSGGTDKLGCHYDRATGAYHCH